MAHRVWLIMIFSCLLVAAGRAEHPTATPEDYIKGITQEIIAAIEDPSLTYLQRQDLFSEIFLRNATIRRTGIFLLGPYARRLSREARQEYLDMLPQYIVTIYFSRLPQNLPQVRYNIKSTQAKGTKGKEFIVYGEIIFGDDRPPLPINWWLLKRPNGHYQVFDISAGGIWLAQEQRAAFTSLIKSQGGDPYVLLEHIKERLREPQGEPIDEVENRALP